MEFQGKSVLITGAASGIGKATALTFAKSGASVLVADINHEAAQQAVEEIRAAKGIAEPLDIDITNYASVEAAINKGIKTYGKIDVLVNNAGGNPARILGLSRDFKEMDLKVIDWGLELNLRGAIYCCRAVVNHMIERRAGKIINMSSVKGCVGGKSAIIYSSAKGGIIAFTKSLAMYLGEYGINVIGVAPGPILSRASMAVGYDTWLQRAGQPEEVANLIEYLASDKAAFITGHTYVIDGGRCWGAKGDK